MTKINEKELKELFLEIKHNNKIAFEKLYEKYNKLVYGIVFSILKDKEDSEDVVQIVFEKLYSIDKNKFPKSKESSWLYSLTKNETISYLRKKNNSVNLDGIYQIEDVDNQINNIIAQDTYNELICKLNEKEKQIVSLKILGDFSFKEIAELIDEPIGTVKWRYYKSVHSLKIAIGNFGMFIITFIIGEKAFFNKDKIEKSSNEILENSEIKAEDETKEESRETESNENINESQSSKGDVTLEDSTKEDLDNKKLDTMQNEEQDIVTETAVVSNNVVENNSNILSIGMLVISIIFLILSIYFLIKHQLKRSKKTSK